MEQNFVLHVVKDSCQSAGAQYDDYYKSFVGLDGKAQAAGTVAGVVMAAVVAFLNSTNLTPVLSGQARWLSRILILGPPTLALITVILSLSVLWVRSTVVPYAALEQIDEAVDLTNLPNGEVTIDHVSRYFRGRLGHLKSALNDIGAAVDAKGQRLFWTQVALALTLISLLVLFFKIVGHVV